MKCLMMCQTPTARLRLTSSPAAIAGNAIEGFSCSGLNALACVQIKSTFQQKTYFGKHIVILCLLAGLDLT